MYFNRLENLIGKEKLKRLNQTNVFVFGLGGVGSYAAEALVRSGIGFIKVVDYDVVDITNMNRQLVALTSTIGHKKIDVFCERARNINPKISIIPVDLKVDDQNIETLLSEKPDYVIDCIDDVFAKVELIRMCQKLDIPIIISLGFANKFHPELIKISTLKKTSVCPLAKVMRKRVKDAGLSLDIPCVYSEEKPAQVIDSDILGSTAFCPSSAGLMMVSYVINQIIEEDLK